MGWLPWAVAGFAGWLGTKLIKVHDEWLKALIAAIFGILAGLLMMHI